LAGVIRRRVAAGAAALGLASVWWVAASPPARACTPPTAQPTEDQRMATAPIVIVGRATAVATRPAPTTTSVTGPAPSQYVYEFDIEYIHKGEDLVDDPAVVVTAVDSSACGFQLELGQLYKLFPTRDGATHELAIAAFDGNRTAGESDLHPYVPGTTTTSVPPTTAPVGPGIVIPVQTIPKPKDPAPTTVPPSTEADPVPPPPTVGDPTSTTAADGDDAEQAAVVLDDDGSGGGLRPWLGPIGVGAATVAAISLAGVFGYRRRAVPGAP
jgi:hypothetical protein